MVHYQRLLLPRFLMEVRGVPITSPALTVFLLAGTQHPGRVERALDHLWAMRLVSYASLHECLEVLAERGRNGTRVFRELLAVRPRDYVPPESNLERRVKKVGEDVGIRLRPQVTVGGTEHIGRADCQFEDLPEGLIEVMSERYHSAPLDQQSDETRFRRYEGAGFFALAVWEHDVWHRLTRSSASSSPSTGGSPSPPAATPFPPFGSEKRPPEGVSPSQK